MDKNGGCRFEVVNIQPPSIDSYGHLVRDMAAWKRPVDIGAVCVGMFDDQA